MTVELAALRPEDSPVLFEWINDHDLVVLNAPFRPVSQAEHDAWFARVQERENGRIFAIREDDRLVGTCQLHSIHPVHRSAELQIRIGAAGARGRGVGTEALRQLLEHGFEQLHLHRIHLYVLADNERALRAYRRVGFREEGVLRDGACIDGRWVDLILMAVLDHEWTGRR
ncbi:MAG TPA: GNAT family protein [Gaiellaceae bacterium]|nr:GNAT family protein [Gaiellaceae bacterium]